ncbi:MAG: zinc-binding dehydrogenase [Chitinivibrionales bacterium]|nr:zinc-binding dehydrogenase [Chitinivibrionales bacterium]MBD3395583.1 zinc-binding dehydrogenase [Chitinivibrionales bacterium]
MKTLALRLYGKNDLRLEEFELPKMHDDEILADIVTNSICMSSHKAVAQGPDHQKVPNDIAQNPVIVGHEFCGTLLEVGSRWKDTFKPGQKYSVQPALNYPGRGPDAPGYSFHYIGGQATKVIIPKEVLEMDCLLPYDGDGFFKASLSEPVSCIIGGFNAQIHRERGNYRPTMGIAKGGAMAILAGAGPMGLGAVDYALHGPRQPRLLVVTDIDQARLDRMNQLYPVEKGRELGVDLQYVNTRDVDAVAHLKGLNGGKGYDDVFVFAPVVPLVEQASALLGYMGCINFFAGPADKSFTAPINFYDVHYNLHHVAGSSGGNTDDMREALDLMGRGLLDPAVMITHVGGIDSAAETIKNLPSIPGGKKLIYTNKAMPLTALEDFEMIGERDPFFAELAAIIAKSKGLWSVEAEQYVLDHATPINVS